MKKQHDLFESIRIKYVVAVMHDNYKKSDAYLQAMQSLRVAVTEFDIKEGFRMHDEIMSAIDFGSRMWKMRRKYKHSIKKLEGVE